MLTLVKMISLDFQIKRVYWFVLPKNLAYVYEQSDGFFNDQKFSADPQKFMYHQRIIPLYFSFKMIYKIFTSLNFVIIVKLVYYTSLKFNLHESSYLEFV